MDNHSEYKHEPKVCARCQTVFECKLGNVEHCQCRVVSMSEHVQKHIQDQYEDCLCAECLRLIERNFLITPPEETAYRWIRK